MPVGFVGRLDRPFTHDSNPPRAAQDDDSRAIVLRVHTARRLPSL